MPTTESTPWPVEVRRIADDISRDESLMEYEADNLRRAAAAMEQAIAERDAARAEARKAKAEARALAVAIRHLSAVSAGVGFAEGVLTNVADRPGYLQELWGKEAITDRMVGAIREALARLEKLHDITKDMEANADANE